MSGVTEEISEQDVLNRRVLPWLVSDDGSVSSGAFMKRKKPDPELSVELARLATPEESLSRCPGKGLSLIHI